MGNNSFENKKCIILANGKPPRKSVIRHLFKSGYTTLICADGGANKARMLNLKPDIIIGDFDSITSDTMEYYLDKSEIIRITSQDDTDVEKALKWAIKNKYTEAVLIGATGDRLDHTLCNLGIVIKFFEKIKINLIAELSILIPYTGSIEIKTISGETVSLYGFNKKTKIKTKGLKYPLDNEALPFGTRESTSNVAEGESVKLKIKGGIIFVIRQFDVLKNNDLI
ncbi:MAG: thiamine diphosphokinase [Ignavibacteriaceae bacterium]|nr:thiamine diphosphokinase [Ignavibacteriaceae bacterium]